MLKQTLLCVKKDKTEVILIGFWNSEWEAGDEILGGHLKNMAGNAQYISPMIQNEILSTASSVITEKLLQEANNSVSYVTV